MGPCITMKEKANQKLLHWIIKLCKFLRSITKPLVAPDQTQCFDLLCELNFCVRFPLKKGFSSRKIKMNKIFGKFLHSSASSL